jgi:hypothetical protein
MLIAFSACIGNEVSSAAIGIEAANFVSSGGVVVQDLSILDNTARCNLNGIALFDVVIDSSSTLSQTAVIASDQVGPNSANGIGILVSVARSAARAEPDGDRQHDLLQ